jgi:Group 4 capsule polysaccharide lipoprotein gfcB, YjbF
MPSLSLLSLLKKYLCIAACVASLFGCSGHNTSLVSDLVRLAWQESAQRDVTLTQVLNPAYRYLRVTLDGRAFLMVLGYVDVDADALEPTEVWYTGQGEVLRLKNGRLLSMTGIKTDWLAVRNTGVPTWTSLAALPESAIVRYTRMRDLKELYQFGIQEQVMVRRIAAPPTQALAGLPLSDLVWLEEQYVTHSTSAQLPPSLFAVRSLSKEKDMYSSVVYSRQCLSTQLCLSLQEWTLQDHAAAQLRHAQAMSKP